MRQRTIDLIAKCVRVGWVIVPNDLNDLGWQALRALEKAGEVSIRVVGGYCVRINCSSSTDGGSWRVVETSSSSTGNYWTV